MMKYTFYMIMSHFLCFNAEVRHSVSDKHVRVDLKVQVQLLNFVFQVLYARIQTGSSAVVHSFKWGGAFWLRWCRSQGCPPVAEVKADPTFEKHSPNQTLGLGKPCTVGSDECFG